MAIPQGFIQDLLARVDVVDVVGRHVKLKKAGANYSGLCPFHTEKSPSFTVSPSKQFFHCFGCGKNGNAIGFLMDHAGMNFIEAVKELAQSCGMTVPEEQRSPLEREQAQQARQKQATLTEMLEKFNTAYRHQLRQSTKAIDYLKGRGLSGEIARQFGLGYAPPGWRFLASVWPDYADPMLLDGGMVIDKDAQAESADGQSEHRRHDRFRDRIMFPIRNVKGECIGFGGRVLGDGTPKYLNSPETPVFSKGRELYGLYEARQAIREAGYVLVTEGYMDVVALAQLGFPNAVATLGTACTTDHVHKLFRFTDSVVFSFDGDAAGRRAARKALDGALPYATDVRNVKFLFLPPEHDPDSFIRAHGADAFARSVGSAMPLSRFMMESAREGCDLDTSEGRALLASQAKPLVGAMPEGVLKSQLVSELSDMVQIGAHELLRLWGTGGAGASAKSEFRRPASGQPSSGAGQGAKWGRRPASSSGTNAAHRASGGLRRQASSREDRAIQLLFIQMSAWEDLSANQHALLCGLPDPHGVALRWLELQLHEHGAMPWSALYETLTDHPLRDWIARIVLAAPAEVEFDQAELHSILLELEKIAVAAELNAITPEVGRDPALFERFRQLNQRLIQLKSGQS
ncbi:MAG: DNA primase [Alphaproteobacteria bacterium]|nr:DNA primase [Alphaproteobacteria bacterium]